MWDLGGMACQRCIPQGLGVQEKMEFSGMWDALGVRVRNGGAEGLWDALGV